MRKALYILFVPLLIIDWFLSLGANIAEMIANSVKDITLALQSYINGQKPDQPKPGK